MRTLNDYGIETEAPLEVAFWTNEEGSRFVPVMMGSGVFRKAFTLEHAYAAVDVEGKSVKDEFDDPAKPAELGRCGFCRLCRCGPGRIRGAWRTTIL